jgi:dolichol-phosphate mannosyltransferase
MMQAEPWASDSPRSVSVILPTYNEAGNILPLINGIKAAMPDGWNYEILVMDDASPDGTLGVVQKAFPSDPSVRAILRTKDRGFAKSIHQGIEQARLERVIVMDSDLTHDPAEISRLLHVGEIYDIVSASRFCAGGRMVDTSHYLISMLYNWMLRLLLRTQVQDNLGGYFTARRSALLGLPADKIFYGYGEYYFRLLHFAQRAGMSIVEIPAWYLARGTGKSKSNWLRMIRTYTTAALALRLRIWPKHRPLKRRHDIPAKERGHPHASP